MRMIIIRDVSIRTRPPRVNAATATLVLLGVAVPLVAALCVGVGQLEASPAEVVRALAHRLGGADDADLDPALVTVIWRLRLPRILVGLCAGAVLSVGGACLQAVVRNDLADPYLLGVSSGASLGAALVIAGGAGGALTTTGGAFLGALAALVLVMALAGGGGLPAAGQQNPRRGRGRSRCGRRVAQGGQERLEEAGLGHRVIVEQDEDILDHAPGPNVDAGAEAPVLARLDHREPLPAKSLGRAIAGGVVHDDKHVPVSQLLTDGAGRPDRQLGLAPVDDDDAG